MNELAAHFERVGVNGKASRREAEMSLHSACAVYTQPNVACRILDSVGWTADADLSEAKLLEPSAGAGVFVMEAAARLLDSIRKLGKPLTVEILQPRISAYELINGESSKARLSVQKILERGGVASSEARRIARSWIRTADFLLLDLQSGSFTHVVGNPPYMRWSKIPRELRVKYEEILPDSVARGDLFLPFMDSGISVLRPEGRLGFLCSNRWKHMAFASEFRRTRLAEVNILSEETLSPLEAFERNVGAYPAIVVIERRAKRRQRKPTKSVGTTLANAGFTVKVGPALGCTEAYVLPDDIECEVEDELLAPWLRPSDVLDGQIQASSRKVICLHDDNGKLRDLAAYPKAHCWLERFRSRLEQRLIVRKQGAPWYRPIDRVMAVAWAEPKLLVPELAKVPRVALDRSGAIPAHGLYAIQAFRPDADIEWLADILSNGGLSRLMEPIAPIVRGGYMRCYKRFLKKITLTQASS